MSINIKEIFQSDNLSVSQDKINYNFDQILANGGGPQGLKGDKGTTGALGSIGPKGDKGEVGSVGPKGNTGADGYWALKSYTVPIDQHTVIPKIQPTSGSTTGAKPTNIVLGVTDTSYAENAADKSSLITLVDENNGSDWTNLVSFRLKSTTYNATTGVIRMIPTSGGARLKIAAVGGTNIFELQANDIQLTDNGGNTKLRLTSAFSEATGVWNFLASSQININATGSLTNDGTTSLLGNNTLGATGKFNNIYGGTNIMGDFLKINPSGSLPAANKILVAADTNGGVYWKNPTEIQGIYPQGSIMFVNPTEITDTYFSLTVYDLQPTYSYSANKYFFGRGKAGTRWAGWYLLMGQTNAWYNDNSTTLFSYVPTNVPGSIIIGASGPDDKVGVTNDEFDSSMGVKKFNPQTPGGATNGYGANYQPQLRGTYNGVGSSTAVNAPRDLTNFLDNDGGYYDTIDGAVMVDPFITGTTKIYPDDPGLAFMPLPMAVYLGRTDLIYNYYAGGGKFGE